MRSRWAGRHDRLDEVQQIAVRPVLDAPDGVVLQGHTARGDVRVQLRIGVAVQVDEQTAGHLVEWTR